MMAGAGCPKGFLPPKVRAPMALRPLLLATGLMLVLLSGCAGTGDDDGAPSTSSASSSASKTEASTSATGTTSSASSSSTGTGTSSDNQAPMATIGASIEQGSIPFNVTFNMTGSDQDGDPLTWTLDADGDGASDAEGTALPANHTQRYVSEGLYNVTFTVTDGTVETIHNLTINATAAAAATGPVFQASGSYTTGVPYAACPAVGGVPAGLWGTPMTEVSFDLPEETYDRPFTAAFTGTGEFVGVAVTFWDAGAGVGAMGDTVSGTVLAGSAYVSLSSCGPAVEITATFTVT
jgi:hypothetical protein